MPTFDTYKVLFPDTQVTLIGGKHKSGYCAEAGVCINGKANSFPSKHSGIPKRYCHEQVLMMFSDKYHKRTSFAQGSESNSQPFIICHWCLKLPDPSWLELIQRCDQFTGMGTGVIKFKFWMSNYIAYFSLHLTKCLNSKEEGILWAHDLRGRGNTDMSYKD